MLDSVTYIICEIVSPISYEVWAWHMTRNNALRFFVLGCFDAGFGFPIENGFYSSYKTLNTDIYIKSYDVNSETTICILGEVMLCVMWVVRWCHMWCEWWGDVICDWYGDVICDVTGEVMSYVTNQMMCTALYPCIWCVCDEITRVFLFYVVLTPDSDPAWKMGSIQAIKH